MLQRNRTLPVNKIPMNRSRQPAPRIVEPQQDRSHESTRRLLDAAAELVAERGYADATVAEIGRRAGYSRGLVSARFGSKENLMWALVQRASDSWFPQLLDPPERGNARDQLLALVHTIGEQVVRDPLALRVLERLIFEAAGELHERFVSSQQQMERSFRGVLRRGIGDGSIRDDIDVAAEAALLVATLRGISYQWFLYPDEVDIVALHEALATQLEERLRPPRRLRRTARARGSGR
jgi:AcrR family transcriptional regulator